MKETILKSIIGGIIFGLSALIVGVGYAAITQVSSGDILTADLFNESMVPTGAVMAFNLSTCPVGWSEANGTDNSLDLRGEFIRGLDNGRGVDSNRVLASWQEDKFKSHDHESINNTKNDVSVRNGGDGGDRGSHYSSSNDFIYIYDARTGYTGGDETRPRNVALLYCVKN